MVLKDPKRKTDQEPKSKRNLAKIMSLAGAWKDMDTEAMKRWRHEGTSKRAKS